MRLPVENVGGVADHRAVYEPAHPWRYLRDDLPDWHVEFVTLPEGVAGETDHDRQVISIDRGLSQAERRGTLLHEAIHVVRDHVDCDTYDDEDVEQLTARILIPLPRLLEVLVWARNSHEAAEELWVDHPLYLTRMNHLHPTERAAIEGVLRSRDFFDNA